jgi:hypothetical protein
MNFACYGFAENIPRAVVVPQNYMEKELKKQIPATAGNQTSVMQPTQAI